MTDFTDRASEHEERLRSQAIARQRDRAALPARRSSDYCEQGDCGQPIPEQRRRALPGVSLCVECQDRLERMGRL